MKITPALITRMAANIEAKLAADPSTANTPVAEMSVSLVLSAMQATSEKLRSISQREVTVASSHQGSDAAVIALARADALHLAAVAVDIAMRDMIIELLDAGA